MNESKWRGGAAVNEKDRRVEPRGEAPLLACVGGGHAALAALAAAEASRSAANERSGGGSAVNERRGGL